MRRGTPGAIKMGIFLRNLREAQCLSMRQVAGIIGCAPAQVSQVEKGQRALKEPKIDVWAKALDIGPMFLRERWILYDAMPADPIIRRRMKNVNLDELDVLIQKLSGPERTRVCGYIEAILEK